MLANGATTLIECGPGKVLTGLNRRIERRPDLAMLAIEDRRNLAAALRSRGECNRLEGEVALVTGASRGIGRAIAIALGRRGATVIGTATSDAGARAIDAVSGARAAKGAVSCSTWRTRSRSRPCSRTLEGREGTPTILVNNAGMTRDSLLLRMSAEDWQTVIETNLSAVYRTCKAVMRGMMKARQGRIINIASVVGVMGNAGQANYAAAKAGMIGFTKILAREVGSRGITVNVVAPGFIDTDMTDALGEAARTALLGQVPARTPRLTRRYRARGGLPGLAAGGLHHRRDAPRQWWHVHDLERIFT